jgi:hypothetical protein
MSKRVKHCGLLGCKRNVKGVCKCKQEGCMVRIKGGFIARCKVMYS